MTIREINRILLRGTPVMGLYMYDGDGTVKQGRITRARLRHGLREVKTTTGAWAILYRAWVASR